MRKLFETIPTTRHGRTYQAKAFRNSYGEYVARLYVNGKAYLPADCYEWDMQSACDTAVAMHHDCPTLMAF